MRVYACSADPFKIENESKPGTFIQGVSLWFLAAYRDNSDESKGHKPMKISVTPELGEKVMQSQLPGIVDIDVMTMPGAGGKATAKVIDYRFVAPVPLQKIFEAVIPPNQR